MQSQLPDTGARPPIREALLHPNGSQRESGTSSSCGNRPHLIQTQTTSSKLLHLLKLVTAMRSRSSPDDRPAVPARAHAGGPATPKCCWIEMLNRRRALTRVRRGNTPNRPLLCKRRWNRYLPRVPSVAQPYMIIIAAGIRSISNAPPDQWTRLGRRLVHGWGSALPSPAAPIEASDARTRSWMCMSQSGSFTWTLAAAR
jgi:hypothetical protein